MGAHVSQLLQRPGVAEELPGQPPGLLGGVLHGVWPLALEEVQVGQEVVGAALALEAGDELEEDAVEAVADAPLVPVHLPGVLLALVQHQRLADVSRHRAARQVQVLVPSYQTTF